MPARPWPYALPLYARDRRDLLLERLFSAAERGIRARLLATMRQSCVSVFGLHFPVEPYTPGDVLLNAPVGPTPAVVLQPGKDFVADLGRFGSLAAPRRQASAIPVSRYKAELPWA